MVTCTLFTSIAFSKSGEIIKKENSSGFIKPVEILNKTRFTAHVTITYYTYACNTEKIDVLAGATGKSINKRMWCLIKKIEATFDNNTTASVISTENFKPKIGSDAVNFTISENAINQEETEFECMVYKSNLDGVKTGVAPGFIIHNKINSTDPNVELQVTINNKKVKIPFGESHQFNTYSGYFDIWFMFKTKEKDYKLEKVSGHYSGKLEVFSKETEKPTYEITGTIVTDEKNKPAIKESICMKKTNTVYNNMMTSATKLEKCGIASFAETPRLTAQ